MKPPKVFRQSSKISGYLALIVACVSSSIGPLRSGAHQLGVRWNTVSCPTVFATSGIACTPVAPVPITATRLPAKSTGSWGQSEVWND